MRRLPAVSLLVAVALLATACTDDDATGSASTVTTPTPEATMSSSPTPEPATPLQRAAADGDRHRVRVLLAHGAPVGTADGAATGDLADLLAAAKEVAPARRGDAADLRLLRAARRGDADAAALALRAGARTETRDEHARTPLLLAATFDRVAVARLLVALGADPDALDDRHDTPWLVTGVTGSVPMLEALLPADPDLTIRNRFGGLSVIPASERGHVAYVRRVVRTGIDVDHVNDLGWTALLEAVILGDGSAPYQEIVRILLDAGADPAIADGDGVTALRHAESRGQTEVARILRRAG
jgi:ankyrin repeat protein